MGKNLLLGITLEIERCTRLMVHYEEIPTGAFALAFLRPAIARAKTAIADGDLAQMIKSYKELRGFE